MKKTYQKVQITVIELETVDVITSSDTSDIPIGSDENIGEWDLTV